MIAVGEVDNVFGLLLRSAREMARGTRDAKDLSKRHGDIAERGRGEDEGLLLHLHGLVVQMIAVGEETGAVDTMLDKIAEFYNSEVKATVEALTSLIEPVLIAVIGGCVGAAVIALYMPMFNIINLIK